MMIDTAPWRNHRHMKENDPLPHVKEKWDHEIQNIRKSPLNFNEI